ncbi:MAG: CPBP family intramembrane metalloprotease [Rhizobium sp.]|nr:CPBP family intramembrane metalloprotease [Rhizobium sp.]
MLTARGDHDRVLLWVEGTPAQLQSLRGRVLHHEVFAHGESVTGGYARHRPDDCAPDSTAISFSRLRRFELAAARYTLDALAREAGAQPCRGHALVYNDLPNPLDVAQWADSLVSLLLVLLIPTGSVLVVYWAASQQHGLPSLWRSPGSTGGAMAIGAAGATAAFTALQLVALATRAFAPWLGPEASSWQPGTLSLPVFLLAGVYAPFLTELAFRAWLLPIASRAVGNVTAAFISALAGTALPWPEGPGDALASLAFGLVMAAVFLRTRSLPACVVAHGGCAVLSLLAGTGA